MSFISDSLPSLPDVLSAAIAIAVFGGDLAQVRAADQPTRQRPNILLLLSDDHCYRALGCAGDRVLRTPNLDRLAAEGVYFDHCFTPMPQCSPSRAAILTGQDCWTSGVRTGTMPFAKDAILWPQLLDAAGYETFYTGKWHNAGMPWDWGFNCGADIYAGGMSDHRHMKLLQWKADKRDRQPRDGFSSTIFADSVIRFLRERKSTRPFCAYVSFTAPHDPWMPPVEYATMYDSAAMEMPPNFMPRPPFRYPADFPKLRDQQVLPFPRTEADVRHGTVQYYGMITQLDHEIGRVLAALKELGMTEDTLVIFAGDHGYSLASHGFVGKQCMYEEGIRLPLILRYPRASREGPTCDALVSLVDLFPTICKTAGINMPASVEGRSLIPLYEGKAADKRTHIFASHHSPAKHGMSTQCIRTERHKLIEHRTTGELELFDLAKDPFEIVNLANKPEFAELQSQLQRQLSQWESKHHSEITSEASSNE